MQQLDKKNTASKLESFVKAKLSKSGLDGFVVGLSGGIDSSLSALIAIKAIGANKLTGLIMPYMSSSGESEKDARQLAELLKITVSKIDITPMINSYYSDIKSINPVRAGNKMARERMSILFDRAFEKKCLVLGTSNRTEICLGYGTWYGDTASSVNPIGMLYKTNVRQLAEYYAIPKAILDKSPTADLWPGQTDEQEIGLDYSMADKILYKIIEENITSRKELNEAGFNDNVIDRVTSLLNRFYFKRHLPEIADLGLNPIPDKVVIK